jgi:hypothetical protein
MKHSKSAVSYAKVGSEKEHCSICRHFERPNRCEKVSGDIAPGGWCRLWREKMPTRLRKTSFSSRRPSSAISERARAKLGGRSGKFSLGYRGAKSRNAIDQDQRPQFPEESEVKSRGAFSTSKRPSNVASPTPPGKANYYGGPSSRPGGGSSSTYYGGGPNRKG